MDLYSIVIAVLVIALIGFVVYLITTYIPMPDPFKQVIIVAVVLLVILWLLGVATGHMELLHR